MAVMMMVMGIGDCVNTSSIMAVWFLTVAIRFIGAAKQQRPEIAATRAVPLWWAAMVLDGDSIVLQSSGCRCKKSE
jgi:hypothetical protein